MARRGRAYRRRQRRQSRRLYVAAAGVALALGTGIALNGGLPFRAGRASGTSGGDCAMPAIELRVISSYDKIAALQKIAADYQRTDPAVEGRCVTIHVGHAAGSITTALTFGLASSPDVWMPESTLWLRALATSAAEMRTLAARDHPSIVTSPTVLAMPRPMAEALGWPDQRVGMARLRKLAAAKRGWASLGHPEWGAFRVDHIDPRISTAKAHTTVAVAYDVAGTTRPTPGKVAGESVVRGLLALSRAPGPEAVDPTEFLAGLSQADEDGRALKHVSVAALDEVSVLAFNHGNSLGVPLGSNRADWPKVPLAAFYPPEGTFVSDHPYVVLTDSAQRRIAAAEFLKHLQAPSAQATFQGYGFRDRQGGSAADANADAGVLPRQPVKVHPAAPADVVAAVLKNVKKLRTPSNVLTVLDVSGSMAVRVPGAVQTRMDLSKQAAINSLAMFDSHDSAGLWTFSTGRRELVPLGLMSDRVRGKPRRDVMRRNLERLTPVGDTALYDTVWRAHQRVIKSYDRLSRNSVILLTDGRNDVRGGLSLDALVRKLKGADRNRPVRILLIAYGADADLAALRRIADASGGAVFASPDPANIDRVFAAAIVSA